MKTMPIHINHTHCHVASADTQDLEKQIDQLVYKLYDLTDEEIQIVEGKQ
jgi:hypothetical protein